MNMDCLHPLSMWLEQSVANIGDKVPVRNIKVDEAVGRLEQASEILFRWGRPVEVDTLAAVLGTLEFWVVLLQAVGKCHNRASLAVLLVVDAKLEDLEVDAPANDVDLARVLGPFTAETQLSDTGVRQNLVFVSLSWVLRVGQCQHRPLWRMADRDDELVEGEVQTAGEMEYLLVKQRFQDGQNMSRWAWKHPQRRVNCKLA